MNRNIGINRNEWSVLRVCQVGDCQNDLSANVLISTCFRYCKILNFYRGITFSDLCPIRLLI